MYSSWSPTITKSYLFRSTVVTLNTTPLSQRIMKSLWEKGQFPMLSPSLPAWETEMNIKKKMSKWWYTKLQTFFWIFNQGYEETGKVALWKEETQVFHWPLSFTLLFIWPCLMAYRILALSDQALNSGLQQWKHTILTTGPPENSHLFLFLKMASLIQHCPRALSAMIETTTVQNSSYLWYVANEYLKCSWFNWTESYLLLINLYLNSHMWLMATILDSTGIINP